MLKKYEIRFSCETDRAQKLKLDGRLGRTQNFVRETKTGAVPIAAQYIIRGRAPSRRRDSNCGLNFKLQ